MDPLVRGKSTLILALTGLLKSRGDILLGNEDLRSLNRRDISRRISVVLQSPDNQFFCNSVEKEICYSSSLMKIKDEDYMKSLIAAFELEHALHPESFFSESW